MRVPPFTPQMWALPESYLTCTIFYFNTGQGWEHCHKALQFALSPLSTAPRHIALPWSTSTCTILTHRIISNLLHQNWDLVINNKFSISPRGVQSFYHIYLKTFWPYCSPITLNTELYFLRFISNKAQIYGCCNTEFRSCVLVLSIDFVICKYRFTFKILSALNKTI